MNVELFEPSEKITEMISSDGNILSNYEIYPFKAHEQIGDFSIFYVKSIINKISDFYRVRENKLNKQAIADVTNEIFKNWAEHSRNGTNFISGLFLGDKGVCYGFKDKDFFGNDRIEYKLENRLRFKEFDKNPRFKSSYGTGFKDHIIPRSDYIEVDSEKGIFYSVQSKKRISERDI